MGMKESMEEAGDKTVLWSPIWFHIDRTTQLWPLIPTGPEKKQ